MLNKIMKGLSKSLEISDYKEDFSFISEDREYHTINFMGDMKLTRKAILPRLICRDFEIKLIDVGTSSISLTVPEDEFLKVTHYLEEVAGEIKSEGKSAQELLDSLNNLSLEECKSIAKRTLAIAL